MRPRVSVRGSVGSILLDLHRRTSSRLQDGRWRRRRDLPAPPRSGGYSIFSKGDQSLGATAPEFFYSYNFLREKLSNFAPPKPLIFQGKI